VLEQQCELSAPRCQGADASRGAQGGPDRAGRAAAPRARRCEQRPEQPEGDAV